MIKLNRKQELALINLGLQSLVDGLNPSLKIKKDKCRKWSVAQHKKFADSMARKWTKKNKKPKTNKKVSG